MYIMRSKRVHETRNFCWLSFSHFLVVAVMRYFARKTGGKVGVESIRKFRYRRFLGGWHQSSFLLATVKIEIDAIFGWLGFLKGTTTFDRRTSFGKVYFRTRFDSNSNLGFNGSWFGLIRLHLRSSLANLRAIGSLCRVGGSCLQRSSSNQILFFVISNWKSLTISFHHFLWI